MEGTQESIRLLAGSRAGFVCLEGAAVGDPGVPHVRLDLGLGGRKEHSGTSPR